MDTPVPIPNTAVKHLSADNTWLETARESKSLPDLYESLESISQGFLCISAISHYEAIETAHFPDVYTEEQNHRLPTKGL